MNKFRAERLQYNIEKQGASCAYIMVKDARSMDSFFSFDKILLDAPCSGSGTLNINNSKMKESFTPKLLEKTVASQRKLLQKAIEIVKVGGEIVYSTCSILEEENEQIILELLKSRKIEIVPIQFPAIEKIPMLPTKIEGSICICPNELYEGFFVAKLRKVGK